MLGVSREQLAEMICVSSQQMLKYECGANRVSIGRLHAIACALNAPIASFYEGLVGEPKVVPPQQRMILKIVRNFADIQNEKHQEALSQVVRALAGR
jgi:transcriptional regulator with XRE-family HTH domain